MKSIIMICLTCLSFTVLAAQSPAWQAFQKDLGIQAEQYKGSPEHQILKQRDTRDYTVGSTHTFWRWNLSVMPPLWIQTPATCRAVGEHSYIFVADSEWNTHMTQANVDTVLARLENHTTSNPNQGAIEMDVSLFGPIPDELDNDPRLIVFYSALGSFQGTSFDGYFSPYNQVTEAQAQQMNPTGHSNECEMIYMTCYPLDPVASIRLSVLAHELAHLIHWGQDANEDTWLDEGCAELAMVAYGVPDPITGFPSNPDNNLTDWNQTTADYVKVMLFFTYLQEHFDDTGLIADLVADPQNGITSLSNQITAHYPQLTFRDIFGYWNIANVVDAPTPDAGLYDYNQLDLPNFTKTNLNSTPYPAGLTLQPYAADYLVYTFGTEPLQRAVSALSEVHVIALFYDQMGNCLEVIDQGYGQVFQLFPGTGGYYQAVYVISNPYSNQSMYSVIQHVANDDPVTPPTQTPVLTCYPNPFRSAGRTLNISLRGLDVTMENSELRIYNLRGERVCSLEIPAGRQYSDLTWDGRDAEGRSLPAGTYILRYMQGSESLQRTVCLLP